MNQNPRLRPVIRSQLDLEDAWRHLMEPLGFAGHSVWLMMIVDDRPLPQITKIEEAGHVPDRHDQQGFVQLLRSLGRAAGAPRFAFLRSRPGRGGPDSRDLAWAELLYAAARAAGVGCEVVHLATDAAIVPLPLDAMTQRSA